MIKAIVFDLGNVIFSSTHMSERYKVLCGKHNKECNRFFEDFGKEWDLAKVGKIPCKELYSAMSEKIGCTLKEAEEFVSGHNHLREEMKKLVLKLKEGYKIGILTNVVEDKYKRKLKLWNFEKVAEVVASCRAGVAKPDKEAIDLIIKKLKLNKDEIVFIDDHPDTIQKYRDYGVKDVLFKNYNKLIQDLNKLEIKT